MSTATEEPDCLDESDVRLARESALIVARSGKHSLKIRLNNEEVTLPAAMTKVVSNCLQIMASGQAVEVLAADEEIGTQQAADILRVSRPYLVKLLDTKMVPSRKVGVQRRVQLSDVLNYKRRENEARQRALAELAAEGQRLDLGE
ncbi:helix-turn-helix domain-containing protein [bacterium]|nr:helix-turn-helix domain-containing protein [bacterium]